MWFVIWPEHRLEVALFLEHRQVRNVTAQLAIGGMDKGDASKVECGVR